VLSLSASKIIGVQFQGDSSAASYGGAGGAAGAIDEDDDGKLCTGYAMTKESQQLCFVCFSSCLGHVLQVHLMQFSSGVGMLSDPCLQAAHRGTMASK